MKTADITDEAFIFAIKHLREFHRNPADGYKSVTRWDLEEFLKIFYPEINWKLVTSKGRKLVRRGVLNGCYCGCRGDYELVEKSQRFFLNTWVIDEAVAIPYVELMSKMRELRFPLSYAQEFDILRRTNKLSTSQVSRMRWLEEQLDKMPCDGVNSNVCVAEGCFGEACVKS